MQDQTPCLDAIWFFLMLFRLHQAERHVLVVFDDGFLPIQFNVGMQHISSSVVRRRLAVAALCIVRATRAHPVVHLGQLELPKRVTRSVPR